MTAKEFVDLVEEMRLSHLEYYTCTQLGWREVKQLELKVDLAINWFHQHKDLFET